MNRRSFLSAAASAAASSTVAASAAGPSREDRSVKRRDVADLCGQRGDDLDPPALPRPDPQGQGGGILALRVLAVAGQGHRRDPQTEPRAGPHDGPVLGVAGEGIRPRDHQSRPGAAGGIRGRDPIGRAGGPEAGRQEDSASWRARRRAGYSREQQTQAVIAALKAGARIVEPEGITIILEPLNILVDHPRQLVVHSAHAAEILKAVGSPNVKMLFDIYHQQISEGNLTGNIRKYRDLIGYFQLADHPGRHEPTTGEISYPYVLRTIHDIGYRDPIGMEMSPKTDPMLAFQAIRRVDAEARSLKPTA